MVHVVQCFENDEPEEFVTGVLFVQCERPWTYAVGHEPRPEVAGVLINEVVPRQTNLYTDVTEGPCGDGCPPGFPDCCRRDEDFIEILNTADTPADLSGCWLSDRYFRPQGWRFPEGSILEAGERVIVWLDDDGGRCADPSGTSPCRWWECPDPSDWSTVNHREWHANFSIDANGDQIFLYDREEYGFGRIFGVDFSEPRTFPGFTSDEPCHDPETGQVVPCLNSFGRQMRGPDGEPLGRNPDPSILANQSLSRIPDGVFTLAFLFQGGAPPPAPGVFSCDVDPTEDQLPVCVDVPCS